MLSRSESPESKKDFWSLEMLGIKPSTHGNSEKLFIQQYGENSIEKKGDTYYAKFTLVCYLIRMQSLLESSYYLPFVETPKILEKYSNVIAEQVAHNFIERVTDPEKSSGREHYLAHHPVFKESSTTPMRIIFHCNFHTKDSPSLK